MFFADGVSKSFGGLDVLEDLSVVVGTGERVGLVGPNGAGKTTLLRLLAGEEDADAGRAGHRGSLGYLRQEAGLYSNRTLVDELWRAFPEARQTEERLHQIAEEIERGEGDIDGLIAEQGRLFDRFEDLDGYRIERRIGRVLNGLGFAVDERTKLCGEFSGGWQMRIALAKVLVRRPECLLLDEPTNHLDARSRDWLAEELSDYRGTVLVVTHDGEFLDRVATRILELRERSVESYAGNYSEFQRQKAARLQQQDRAAARQERAFARRTARRRSSRAARRRWRGLSASSAQGLSQRSTNRCRRTVARSTMSCRWRASAMRTATTWSSWMLRYTWCAGRR